MELNQYLDYLVEFIRTAVKDANAKGVIVGISGGIDSAVVACLAKKAFPSDYQTLWMPIESSDEDYSCKDELIKQCNLNNLEVDLLDSFNTFKGALKESNPSKLALANLKARLRMSALYAVGQTNNYLVLGTDNADEWYIGYFTKFGDGGVDVVPLIHLLKSEVKQAAKLLNVPNSIINRAPTASLWENQTDESEIGHSYDEIDAYLLGKSTDSKLKERVEHLHKISDHKRTIALAPKSFERK